MPVSDTGSGVIEECMQRNLLKAGFRRQRLMSGIPGSFAWILLTLLAVGVGLPLHYASMSVPPVTKPPAVKPPPESVETRIPAEGLDSHQRSLPFTVYVLTEQLSWKLESATDLEDGQRLLSPELTVAINRARDVFCVGTASFEGVTRLEEARAGQRAAQLAQWVAPVIRDPVQTRLIELNAGQYRGPPELDSAHQRKAILIVTGPHDDAVNLSEGLISGLEKQQQAFPSVYSLLHHYSRSKEWLKGLKGREEATRRDSPRTQSRLAARNRVRR
jgi:hypothetical protein